VIDVTRHRFSTRSGITLTEILIAIMILGVGMVSLATLFPLGLMRLRDAKRATRSTILAESAIADAAVRGLPNAKGLLNADTFLDRRLGWYEPWRVLNTNAANAGFPFTITPLTHDLDTINNNATAGVAASFFTPGLPVAYDPLFWSTTHFLTEGSNPVQAPSAFGGVSGLRGVEGSEGRFGAGVGFIRNATVGPAAPPAYGLQRITNFRPYDTTVFWPYTYSLPSTPQNLFGFAEVAGKVFTSIDDPVLTGDESGQSGSPVVPADFDPGPGYSSERDYSFSWMVTGQLGVAGDPATFEGNLVVFQNRPIGLDPTPDAFNNGDTHLVPTGERVVEAIFGYTSSPAGIELIENPLPAIAGSGYSIADDRTVLLRWPASTADPLIRVGDFIADVTYERYVAGSSSHYPRDLYDQTGAVVLRQGVKYAGQRIHWYRIVQRGEVEIDPDVPGHYRRIVRVDTSLRAKTRLIRNTGSSPVPEAALINPYVVNVFPIILYSR
jgi:type II secretory pathway pseudopilin PulG